MKKLALLREKEKIDFVYIKAQYGSFTGSNFYLETSVLSKFEPNAKN